MPYTPGAALDGLKATLGSAEFGRVAPDGTAVFLQTLEGWDSSESRSEFTDREADHGAWASPVYLSSRPVTLGGVIDAPSQEALEQTMENLRTAASLTDTVLTVWEARPKQAVVRRSGKPLMQYITDTKATYSLMVTAPDPRRYGVTLESGTTNLPSSTGGLVLPATFPITFSATVVDGQITAVNAGTIDTRPVLTITGPAIAPIVVAGLYPDGTVRQLVYSQSLQSGDVLTIDTDAHTVLITGGVSRRRFLTVSGGWPVIAAGRTVIYRFQAGAYNATATLTAQWRSAWM